MISEGRIMSSVTTLRFQDKNPVLHISILYFIDKEASYGFMSGDGVIWLAKILHAFNINNLEELIYMDIEIEQDAKDKPMNVKCKDTGLSLGIIEPDVQKVEALNSEHEVYKMNIKETK